MPSVLGTTFLWLCMRRRVLTRPHMPGRSRSRQPNLLHHSLRSASLSAAQPCRAKAAVSVQEPVTPVEKPVSPQVAWPCRHALPYHCCQQKSVLGAQAISGRLAFPNKLTMTTRQHCPMQTSRPVLHVSLESTVSCGAAIGEGRTS